jgi:hypothetical protein
MIDSTLSLKKQVKHTIVEYAFSPTTTPLLINPIYYPQQGISAYNNDDADTSQGQRIGNQIVPYYWDWNVLMYDSTAGTESVVRLTLFEWLMPINHSDEVPTVGDIYESSASAYLYLAPLNYDTRTQYNILFDGIITLVTGSESQVKSKRFRFHTKDFTVKQWKFIGDSQFSTSAALIKGNIFAFFTSDGAIETPDIEWSSYLCYTD